MVRMQLKVQTMSHSWFLLMLLAACCYVDGRRQLSPLDVRIGGSVALPPLDISHSARQQCMVEVLADDPLSLRVGSFRPDVFPCDFKQGSVRYSHNGAPIGLAATDQISLRVFRMNESGVSDDPEELVLPVRISGEEFKFIRFVKNLTVTTLRGNSQPIDSSSIEMKVNPLKEIDCVISIDLLHEQWPKYGKLVYVTEESKDFPDNVDSVRNGCEAFLDTGFEYEHYQQNSPKWDYVPITIEVTDRMSGLGTEVERVFVPIHIEAASENTAPAFSISQTPIVVVNDRDFKSLSVNTLAAFDNQTKKELLIYNISKPLAADQGRIMKRDDDKCVPVYSFLEKDLEEFKIIYYPPGREVNHGGESYSMELTVLDSEYAASYPIKVDIRMSRVVSNTPWAAANRELVVIEGQEAVITPRQLKIVDLDNPEDVIVTVQKSPVHGSLTVNGRSNQVFSVEDIADHKLKYLHDGSDSTEDKITLSISDSENMPVRIVFRIKILAKDDSPPFRVSFVPMNVNQWSSNQLTATNLQYTDSECPDEMLLYKIVSTTKHGQLVKKYPYDVSEVVVNEFTLEDIQRNLIFYSHSDSRIADDSFSYVVEDCVGNRAQVASFDIAVLPSSDKPPKPDESARHRVTVLESEVKVITSSILGFSDADTLPSKIIYKVLVPLHFADTHQVTDAGALVLSETVPERRGSYQSVDQFTQLDLEQGRLFYIPPQQDIGLESRNVLLVYEVDDSMKGETFQTVLKANALNITVIAVDDKAPSATVSTLEVEDSSFALILPSHIAIRDVDTRLSALQMRVSRLPRNGMLVVDGHPGNSQTWFNVSFIEALKLRYDHDGSLTTTDEIRFEVRDTSNNLAEFTIPVEIIHISDHAPVLHPDLDTDLIVQEGSRVVISAENLRVNDVDTSASRISYIITTNPRRGVIKNGDRLVFNNRFSQADVNAGNIVYEHSTREIGLASERDHFQVMFTDQDLPRLDQSVDNRIDIQITIQPVDNSAPIVFTSEVEVEEGGEAHITTESLAVSDRDSPLVAIGFVVVEQPEWGYIKFADSRSPAATHLLTSFTYGDLQQMKVSYVQDRHRNVEPIADKIKLYATDGRQVSQNYTLPIRINPVCDEIPEFSARNITVNENGYMLLDDIFISATDLDKPADELKFYIDQLPLHGYITNKNYTGSYKWLTRDDNIQSFAFEELARRYISVWYYHDCSESTEDQFTIRLSDGIHSIRHTIFVTIVSINDEVPSIRHAGGVSVKRDQSARLSHFAIIADDVDTPNDQLFFLIQTWPKAGYFSRKQTKRNRIVWEKLDAQSMPFTQQDIDEGNIMYQHNSTMNPGMKTDVIAFVVSDGINLSKDSSFKISILDDDKSPISLVNNRLTLNAGSKAVITTEYLNADDYANRPSEIVFSVDDAPSFGKLEDVRFPGVAVTSFTQAQIVNKEIRYAHLPNPAHDSRYDAIQDSFNLIVANGQTWLNETFHITIKVNHQLPTLVENKNLQLRQGTSKDITIANLHVLDPDTKSRNLTYIIMQKPAEGTLRKGNRTIEYSFTQFDIDNQDITYHHHGTDHIHDDFRFSISDGTNSMYFINKEVTSQPITFQIDIMVPKPNQLQIKSTVTRNLVVNQGNYGYRLSDENIQVKGSSYSPSEIEFTIVRRPIYGKLIYYDEVLPVGNSFTYDELINSNIMYVIKDEILATNDSFAFDVQDANGKFTQGKRYDLSWASIEFKQPSMTVCEDVMSIGIKVVRYGWVGGRSQVEFKIKDIPSNMQDDDYYYNRQVVFEQMESEKEIKLEIKKNDNIMNQDIKLVMRRPDNAVLGKITKMDINIIDETDASCLLGKHQPSFDPEMPPVNLPIVPPTWDSLEPVAPYVPPPEKDTFGEQYNPVDKNTALNIPSLAEMLDRPECGVEQKGLLHYDREMSTMFVCDGTSWQLWTVGKPASIPTSMDQPVKPTCPNDWTEHQSKCYFFIKDFKTWDEANDDCEHRGSKLASIDFGDEEHKNWLIKLTSTPKFWTGLNRLYGDSWRWTDGSRVPSNLPWGKNEKDARDPRSNRKCSNMNDKGNLQTRPCSNPRFPYVCTKPISDSSLT